VSEDYRRVSLDTIAGGAAGERFQEAMKEIIENLLDPNTDDDSIRKIKMTFKFKPTSDAAGKLHVSIETRTELAPPIGVESVVWVGKEKGAAVGYEQNFKQQNLPFNQEEPERKITLINQEERNAQGND